MKKNELFKVYLSTGRNQANLNRTAIVIFSINDNINDIHAYITLDHLRAGYNLQSIFESDPMSYYEAVKLASGHCNTIESVLQRTA